MRSRGELILRGAKSGELVTVLLPDEALAAPKAIEQPARQHYFWTGESDPVTACKYWRSRLKLLASGAGIDGFHPHRLRDTFAVELLLSDMCIDDLSTLLGSSSTPADLKLQRFARDYNDLALARFAQCPMCCAMGKLR